MGALLQSLNTLILFVCGVITLYYFFRNISSGIFAYLIFMCISGFFGFSRPVLFEGIILPLGIIFGKTSPGVNYKVHWLWIIILCYTCLTTIIAGNDIFNSMDEFFVFGFIMLALSDKVITNNTVSVKILGLLWVYALARSLYLLKSGAGVFEVSSESRMMTVDSGLADVAVIDPNYFGFVTGIGATLSLLFVKNLNNLRYLLGYTWLKKFFIGPVIIVIGILELYLTMRGLSRGMFLAVAVALLTYLLLQRKFKSLCIAALFLCLIYFLISMTPLYNLYISRFKTDDNGAGRYALWFFIWNNVVTSDSLTAFFGNGLNYNWWSRYFGDFMKIFSTHNSWMTILLNCGVIGLGAFVWWIIENIRNGLNNLTWLNEMKIVVLAYVIIGLISIEPLHYTWGWIPFLAAYIPPKTSYSCATYHTNHENIKRNAIRY